MVVTSVVVLQVKDSKKPAGNRLRAYIIPSNIALCQYNLHGLPIAYPFRVTALRIALEGWCCFAGLLHTRSNLCGRYPGESRATQAEYELRILSRAHFARSPTASPYTDYPYRRLTLKLPLWDPRGKLLYIMPLHADVWLSHGRGGYEPILVIGLTYIGCLSDQYRSRRGPI